MLQKLFADKKLPNGETGCEAVQQQLTAYLDGDLTPAERDSVERHLHDCAACRVELSGYRQSESALVAAGRALPSPGSLLPAFHARLDASRRSSGLVPNWRPIGAALAAAALLGAAFLYRSAAWRPMPTLQQETVAAASSAPSREQQNPSGSPNSSMANADVRRHTNTRAGGLTRSRQTGFATAASISKATGGSASRRIARRRRSGHTLVASNSRVMRSVSAIRPNLVALASLKVQILPNREDESPLARPALSKDERLVTKPRNAAASGTVLASLTTETDVHISDEHRDFMENTTARSEALAMRYRTQAAQPDAAASTGDEPTIPAELDPLP